MQPEAAAQIKTQCRKIAVGHRQPEPCSAFGAKLPRQRFDQSGPRADAGRYSVKCHQLGVAAEPLEGSEPSLCLGDQRRQSSGIDDLAVYDDCSGPPPLAQNIADPYGIGRASRSDRRGRRSGLVDGAHISGVIHSRRSSALKMEASAAQAQSAPTLIAGDRRLTLTVIPADEPACGSSTR